MPEPKFRAEKLPIFGSLIENGLQLIFHLSQIKWPTLKRLEIVLC